jgi:RNA recognition motif-containing protein
MGWENCNTRNLHIGNLLSEATDEEIQEILQQFMKKKGLNSNEQLTTYISNVMNATSFYYDGEIREDME